MKTNITLILAAALALAPLGAAGAAESTSSVSFSDPSKPGTLKVRVFHGDVTIRGADVKEVSVKASADISEPAPRKDGMRVLSSSSSYSLSEKGNVVSLEYGGEGWTEGSADFDITVPSSTMVVIANAVRGDIECSGLTGDIDVRTTHGDVKLDDLCAGALVETVKGDIEVTVKSLAESKPLCFTSMSGEVTIHAPADLKAAIRFRTHRGVILTNFDDKALATKTEISKRQHKGKAEKKHASMETQSDGDGQTYKYESDDDWREQLRDSIRDAAQEAAEAAREATDAAREGLTEAGIAIGRSVDEVSPIPPLPPMTGGKTVSGTLNGGGVEIQAATLNGDITLKKIE